MCSMESAPDRQLILASEAARLLSLSVDSVRRLARSGVLPSKRVTGGIRLFERRVVEALAEQRRRDGGQS